MGRAEPAQIWGSWKMRRTKPISSSVPAKQKRGGKRICGGKGAGTLSWAWLYRSWVSKELLGARCGGARPSARAGAPAAEQLRGWGRSLCQGCPCPGAHVSKIIRGMIPKQGPGRAGAGTSRALPHPRAFLPCLLLLEEMGVPHELREPFRDLSEVRESLWGVREGLGCRRLQLWCLSFPRG